MPLDGYTLPELPETDEAKVNVIVVYNPLDLSDRKVDTMVWEKGKTLACYLDGLPEGIEWHVTVAGNEMPKGTWHLCVPAKDDWITLIPIPAGGGSGKQILRLVAMLAVSIIGAGMGAAFGAGLSGALGGAISATTAGAIITAGVTVLGGALVNALLPVPKAKSPARRADETDSPTYGLDGPKNISMESAPLGLIYGQFRYGGNIVNTQTVNDGDTQVVFLRAAVSEGEIEGISDFELNDQPLSSYSDVEVRWTPGRPDEEVLAWFDDTILPINKNLRLTQDWTPAHTTTQMIDRFRIDVVFPSGLFSIDRDSGERQARTVTIQTRYRKPGAPWIQLPDFTVTDSRRTTLRRSIEGPVLEEGVYEIQVRRTNAEAETDYEFDQVTLTDINEIVLEDVALVHTATMALKVRLNDQISNLSKFTGLVKGIKVPHYDAKGNYLGTWWDDNPAWIALDLATNARYGGGMRVNRFVMSRFKKWADYCVEKGLRFNGVIDYETNVWDALQVVLRVGHAQLISVGTRISVAIERPDAPVMMFGSGNIIKGSFGIDWLSTEDRANEIEIVYFDRADGNKQKAVRVVDDVAIRRGEPTRSTSITILGVDNHEQAIYEAHFQLALNRFIRQKVSFESPLESIACTLGDLVLVQHDMPLWGHGGRLKPGSTTTRLILDRPVPIDLATDHMVLIHHPAVKVADVTITVVEGRSVYVEGLPAGKRVGYIRQDGNEYPVDQQLPGTPYTELVLSEMGARPGAAEAWDTDVIEEALVEPAYGEVTEVVPRTPLSTPPTAYVNWMFGPVNKVKKPFRITGISGTHDYKRGIEALEYNASVYERPKDAIDTPNYSSLPTTIDHVRDLTVIEELFRSGAAIRTRLVIGWTKPATGLYEGANILISENGLPFVNRGRVFGGATSFSLEVTDLTSLQIKVVAVDVAGTTAHMPSAPVVAHMVVGKTAPPADVRDFKVEKVPGGIKLSWAPNTEIDLKGYEIRRGANWDEGEVVVTDYPGNVFFSDKVDRGIWTYHIRAFDIDGNPSENATSFTLEVPGPRTVRDFAAILNNEMLVLSWTPNTEPDIAGYEIRQGPTWELGSFVARPTNSYHAMPANLVRDPTFWVKAYDSSKIFSETAVFATPRVAKLIPRNVLAEQDEKAAEWPAFRYNTLLDGETLALQAGQSYGEYVYRIDLGREMFARHVIEDDYDVVLDNLPTWQDGKWVWNSPEGARPWTPRGDLTSARFTKQIAAYVGEQMTDVEAWSLNGSTDGVRGTPAVVSEGISFGPGRFGDGAVLEATSQLGYDTVIPEEFRVAHWVRPTTDSDSLRMIELEGSSGFLRLAFLRDSWLFRLESSDGKFIEIPGVEFQTDDQLLIAISQSATTRSMFIGRLNSDAVFEGSVTAPPIGAFTRVTLAR